MFVLRVVWAFFGNRFSREILAVPVNMFSAKWWDGLIDQTKYYLFLKRMHVPGRATTRWPWRPCSSCTCWARCSCSARALRCTAKAWAWTAGPSVVLVVGPADVRLQHERAHAAPPGHVVLVVFTIVHFYMVLREDICSDETVMSTMINGWRVAKK
jgi:Ni/Fe-hydrogenase 1 B-type cytochrome subunit